MFSLSKKNTKFNANRCDFLGDKNMFSAGAVPRTPLGKLTAFFSDLLTARKEERKKQKKKKRGQEVKAGEGRA